MSRNLSNLYISESFQYLVQISGSEFETGLGSSITFVNITASNATFAVSSSNSATATSASYSLTATSSSFASTAQNSTSASYALTASYAVNAGVTVSTASLLTTASATNNVITFTKGDSSQFTVTVATGSAVTVNTGSLLVTASITNATTTFTKGDGTQFSLTANNVVNATSASYSVTADTATSASFASTAISSSFATSANTANTATSSSFASFAVSSSNSATAISSSYSSVALSSSFATSAQTATSSSFATNAATATSASFATTAATASYYNEADTLQTVTTRGNSTSTTITASGFYSNGTITTQNAVVLGTASIAFLDVTYQSSSVIYSSGSNQFGDASNDVQTLFGTVDIKTGPLKVTGSANFQGGLTGSLLGTASYANVALSASYAVNADTASYFAGTVTNAISSSYPFKKADGANSVVSAFYPTTAGANDFDLVIGGSGSKVNSGRFINTIVGSAESTITGNAGYASGIFSSWGSTITAGGLGTTIIGGYNNTFNELNVWGGIMLGGESNSTGGSNGRTFILAGRSNVIQTGGSSHSGIAGGYNNNINNSPYSAIIAGQSNYVNGATNTVILGGSSITAAASNTVYVPNLVVTGSAVTASITNVVGNWTDTYTSSPKISTIVTLTQAEYNAISSSADPNTFYIISDSTGLSTSIFATTGSNTFVGSQIISGSLSVTSGITGSMFGTASFATFALGAGAANSATSASYAVSSSFATNAATATSASFATNAATATTASFYSLASVTQNAVFSGSVRGEVRALSISSNTASMDCSLDNFFTLSLVSGSNTYINPTNIAAGQTINLRVTQANPGNGTVSFPTSVKQVSGSSYVPSTGTGPVDIVTFISFDASSLYLSNVKNLI
jgi:hypothetical protein